MIFRKQKDGTYNVYNPHHVGLVRKNREGKWVATSFSKGVSIAQGVYLKNREEAGQWLTK